MDWKVYGSNQRQRNHSETRQKQGLASFVGDDWDSETVEQDNEKVKSKMQ